MSSHAARCPFCGVLQARAPVSEARRLEEPARKPLKVSTEEAQALLAVHSARGASPAEPPFNILAWFFSPSGRGTIAENNAEVGLTILALPLLVSGLLGGGFALPRLVRAGHRLGPRVIAMQVVLAGGFTLVSTLYMAGLSFEVSVAALIVELAALGGREWVRLQARSREAPRLD